ncbi:hypothetical protein EJB05_52636, partial [Eragrostis curvula]
MAAEGSRPASTVRYEIPALNFHPGLGLQDEILKRFALPVVFLPYCGLKEFFLVVSVGRCKFKLDELLVAYTALKFTNSQ